MPVGWDLHACSINACSIAEDPAGIDVFGVMGGLSWAAAPIAVTPIRASHGKTDLMFAAMVARRAINVNQSAADADTDSQGSTLKAQGSGLRAQGSRQGFKAFRVERGHPQLRH